MSSTPELSALRAPRRATRSVRAFLRDAAGASMAEYALLIGAVALIGVVGAARLGRTIRFGAEWVANMIHNA